MRIWYSGYRYCPAPPGIVTASHFELLFYSKAAN